MRDGTLISEIVIFHSIFRKLFTSILQGSVSSSVSGAGLLQAEPNVADSYRDKHRGLQKEDIANIGFAIPPYLCLVIKQMIIMKIFGLPGTSFSPRRAIGVDVLKRSVAKKTGVPLTKSGAERKIGRTIIKAVGKLFEK